MPTSEGNSSKRQTDGSKEEEEEEEEEESTAPSGSPPKTSQQNTVTVKPGTQTAEKKTSFVESLGCTGGTLAIKEVLCPNPENLVPDELADEIDDTALFDPEEEEDEVGLDTPTEASDMRGLNRRIWVVTTAALPWRTGTAVNPLLRALYLTRDRPKGYVTLVIPWLENEKSRRKLYGKDHSFSEGGQAEQEEWIRSFCRERANCEEEEANLRIMFYRAEYHRAFGSIFPSVDICAMIPNKEADIAILEEPEHLNWFRVPEESDDTVKGKEECETEDQDVSETKETQEEIASEVNRSKVEFGWAHKFRHVVGILHTNYSAYMTQYAMGTSFIAAPAISMLSSIVVRAYCHRVIRLSAVLPSLAENKEVTSNVHGVRSEFLLPALPRSDIQDSKGAECASIYFIGKLIWAKGFDKLLEAQDMYRKSVGSYFPIDIYGAGSDDRAIERAFLGRHPTTPKETEVKSGNPEPNVDNNNALTETETEGNESKVADEHAQVLFQRSDSLRKQILSGDSDCMGEAARQTPQVDSEQSNNFAHKPFSIVGDLTGKSVSTAVATSQAVYSLADSIVNAGLNMTISWEKSDKASDTKNEGETFFFDPPQSRYEWRRQPIPARFLGVKDHALLREIPEHKIFLNMSTTEVLCTTTAEALAMGKFAIIPKHPSNEFFFQFPNCLTYETLSQCVEKIKFALDHEPTTLTAELAYKFTWEGAKERLFEASSITRREMMERIRSGAEEADKQVCWWHVQGAKRGHFISSLVSPRRPPKPTKSPGETKESSDP